VQAGASGSNSVHLQQSRHCFGVDGNYTASAGTISGSRNIATLNTGGASPGTITVSTTCSDQRGLSTPATSEITIEAPPPVNPEVQRLEQRLSLHSIYFRPHNQRLQTAVAKSQQETLVALAADFRKYLDSKPI
jgi:hypothetical protein